MRLLLCFIEGLGDNFWIIDMDMDCSQTQNGWFEFTTIYSIGGEDGEPSVEQEACTGDVGGESPITGSKFHMARCGYTNIFSYGKDTCQIDPIPWENLKINEKMKKPFLFLPKRMMQIQK